MKNIILVLAIFVVSFNFAMSQDEPESLLPKLLGASNLGKEFYLTFHPNWDDQNTENALHIYISSQFKTNVKLEIPGISLVKTKETIPNGVIEFVLYPYEGQVYSNFDGSDTIAPKPEKVWAGRAIRITADDPVICYGVSKFNFNTEGYLALPVNSWGKNYQVSTSTGNIMDYRPSYTSIIASNNNTKVTFRLGGSGKIKLENGDTLKFGGIIKKTLMSGDVWLIPGTGSNHDLSGSQISSDKIISVISGNFCADLGESVGCNYLIEQEIASEFWGKSYFVPMIKNEKSDSRVKIFASEPSTKININGISTNTIQTAGGKQDVGYLLRELSDGSSAKPVMISSEKNINVVLFNKGKAQDKISSEPFQMNIISKEQFINESTFIIPNLSSSLGITNDYLSIILQSKDNKIPDDMLIGMIESDSVKWSKLKDFSNDTLVGFKNEVQDKEGFSHYLLTLKMPVSGVYKLKANKPFGVYGYGFDYVNSYGFPYSCSMIDQSSSDSLAPNVSVENLGNGKFRGIIKDQGLLKSKTNKNEDIFQSDYDIAGLSFVEMINGLSNNYKFERDSFIPGDDAQLDYILIKIDIEKDSKAVIFASDRRGNDTTIILEDFVDSRSMTPLIIGENFDFGLIKNGWKKHNTFKIKCQGLKESKSVLDLVFDDNNQGFKIVSSLNYPLTLKVDEEVEFVVEFTGSEVDGIYKTNLGVKTQDTTLYRIQLTATVSNPTINTSDVDFSSIIIGNPSEKSKITIANTGKTVLEINKIDFPKNSCFTLQVDPPSNTSPLLVPANSSISVDVQFDPQTEGEFNDSIVFYSDGKILKNVSYLHGNAINNSVEEFENKYGVINLFFNENEITFSSQNEIILNSYKIYDLKGEIIQTDSPATLLNNFNIKLPNLTASVYFVELNTQYGKVVKKIVLE